MRLKHPADNGNVAILNNVSDIPDNRSWLQPPHTNASTNLNSTNYTENYQIISNYHNYRKETKSEELSTDVGVRLVCNDLYRLNSQNTINNFKETSFCIDNADGTSSVGNKCIDKTNVCSTTETPVDEEPSFEHADSDEMSEKVIHPVPRGIVNPNYPGFQHLAHTLQDYSSNIESFYQSENEMTDDDIDTELTEYTSDLIPHIADTCMEYENCNNNNNNHIPDECKQLSTDSHTICLNSNIHSDIPDLLKTVSKTNNNCESIPNELNCSDTDIENNFNTKDIIGDFNKEIEDEIKLLLNYNISIQDDLEELRKDIQDTLAKPIENTINNISDVVNHVIKKLVETHTDSLDKGEQDTDFNNRVEYYDISDINKDNETNTRTEMNLSRPTFLLIENDTTDRITDAFLSDGKDEIHIYDNEYETENLSRNVENTIKQLSTELRKIIPKLDEMKERDRFWNGSKAEMDRYIMDTNSNAIAGSSQFSRSSESTAQEQTKEATQMKSSFPIAQSNASVQKEENSKDYDLGSFDVYNIETALPKLDLDAIENHLRAAKEAERRKRNDREEIRKRLAMGADAEEYYSLGHTDRPGKKPSLHSRLQNGKNLQICFMNETASDNESQASDVERSTNSSKSSSRTSLFSKSSYNHPYQTRPLSVNITKNDKISTVQSGAKLRPSSLSFKSNKSRSSQSLSHIELRESDFYALQATLQTEARMALAQAKEMARIQMERERRSRPVSPVTEMLRRGMQKAGAPLAPDRRRVSRQLLTDLNIAQLQVIVNELHSQIESLNDNLVKLLMARDELHMGQDSMLVDIEDLTRYLGVKEQTKKTKGTKSAVRRLTSLVHK